MTEHFDAITNAIISGLHKEIVALVEKALQKDEDPNDIVNQAMIPAMDTVGNKFSNHEIFVPEMLAAAYTMNKGLDIIKPILLQSGVKPRGTIIMCTVKGDLHDIGKNLVTMMLKGAGFNVIDLGVDMSVDNLVEKVKEIKPDVLGLSALLTTTMSEMSKVIKTLETNGLRHDVRVMVGGAPVDEFFSKKIGADAYGRDAAHAVEIARGFIS